jgi:hypothetical protein
MAGRGSILPVMTTSRTYLESDRHMPAVSSTCAKREWAGLGIDNQPTSFAPLSGRPEAAL